MTEMRAIGRDTPPGDAARALRVALVLDPGGRASAGAAPEIAGVDVHLHFAEPGFLSAREPFLRRMDVAVIEIDTARPGQFDDIARLVRELAPVMPVIAAGRALTVTDTRRLLRAGAVDVLPLPASPEDFAHALDAARDAIESRAGPVVKQGRTVSFLRAIGGVGATAIATQAGCLWAAGARVCLIDLDLQFGAAALYLDLKPGMGLIDLIEAQSRLDTDFFMSVAARHASGLHVVAGPNEVLPLDILTPQLVGQIVGVATQAFDIVLLDLPAAWTTWSLAALSQSDIACLVTTLTVPGIHQARRQLDVMEAQGLAAVPTRIVLNRVASKFFRTIDLGDTEKVLRRKVDFTIANDFPTVSTAVDQGRPLAQVKGKTKVERDVAAMVAALGATLDADRAG